MTPEALTLAQARRTAVAASGLADRRPGGAVDRRHLRRVLARTLLLQLDSVSVFARAHYVPPFSRLGPYPPGLLDGLAAPGPRRELFEYWGREASLLPLALHPLLRWRMDRAARLEAGWGGTRRVARDRPEVVARVLERLRDEGPATAGELREAGVRRAAAGWWEWDEVKQALEHLFWAGRVTTHSRRGFERVYDLVERVLPAAVLDLPTPEPADAVRELVRLAAVSQGVCTARSLADAWKLGADAAPAVRDLVEEGALRPVVLRDGRTAVPGTWYLAAGAPLPRRVRARALLSPFDPLVRERERTERLLGFHYRLEIYVPAARRVHGYYVLPYLHDDALAARVDLKADRTASALRVLAAWGEPGTGPEQVAGLAQALREAAVWQGLERVEVAPVGDLATRLAGELRTGELQTGQLPTGGL